MHIRHLTSSFIGAACGYLVLATWAALLDCPPAFAQAEQGHELSEVIVTAQRREENLQQRRFAPPFLRRLLELVI
jgi:hypothetical protein